MEDSQDLWAVQPKASPVGQGRTVKGRQKRMRAAGGFSYSLALVLVREQPSQRGLLYCMSGFPRNHDGSLSSLVSGS
jgi:hypothetical protein